MTFKEVQLLGEDAAQELLQRRGMEVLARNWRCRWGELDLVAMEGATIVFVEVKCRRQDALYDPALAVDHRKRMRLRRMAEAFIAVEGPSFADCRFDVVGVVAGSVISLEHLVDAF